MATLPDLKPGQSWCCGRMGSGPTTPIPVAFEYVRTTQPNGDGESKWERHFACKCCGGELLLWDEGKNDFLDWCYVEHEVNNAATPANPPVDAKVQDPIVELNVALLRQRSEVGVAKYGTTMVDSGLGLRAWLQHALEEGLDLVNYLQAAIQKLPPADSRANGNSFGLPSCGKPLCSEGDHHPLCAAAPSEAT